MQGFLCFHSKAWGVRDPFTTAKSHSTRGHLLEGHPHLVESARLAITVASTSTVGGAITRVSVAIAVWLSTIAVAKGTSRTAWAIGIWSKLLRELLLLGNGILDSLLLGRHVVLVLFLLGGDEVFVLLLLSLHELLALVLSLLEGLLLCLTDLANLLGGHTVWAVRVSTRVAIGTRVTVAACVSVWEHAHDEEWSHV